MKKIKLITFALIVMFLSISKVYAFDIYTIDMDIKLDEYGVATVVETWDTNVTDGSEIYHPYYSTGNTKFRMLSASMDGKEYEIVANWNESAGLEAKAYKAGLLANEHEGIDIVVGKTSYGRHIYKFTYQMTDFIANLTDSDMIYWTLIPSDFEVDNNVTIKISGPYTYPDTLEVWGYGMYGAPCYVKDGAIYMTSDGKKDSGDNLVLLAKYPKGKFLNNNNYENEFDYYLDMAEEGATSYTEEKMTFLDWIAVLLPFLINAIVWLSVIMGIIRANNKNKVNYDFGVEGKTLPKNVNNFREIPCNKDIYRAFWVADTYNLNKNKNDFFGVLLLKWIYDGNVLVKEETVKKIIGSKKQDVIIFDHEPAGANKYEQELYKYMKEASGDNILEKDEFKKWCKKHYDKILGWTDKVLKYEREELIKSRNINDILDEKGLVFKYKVHRYFVKPNMREEAIQMKGLKQFFHEFSQIHKKEPIEVKLWNEYLMYAQIFGVAKLVMERFKELYPEVIEDMESYNFDYTTFMFVDSITSSGVSAASAARQAAQSYSSGGGGFSSGGGGGGSFGGGFGGGSGSR